MTRCLAEREYLLVGELARCCIAYLYAYDYEVYCFGAFVQHDFTFLVDKIDGTKATGAAPKYGI